MCNGNSDSEFCFAFSDNNGTQQSEPAGTLCIGLGFSGHMKDPRDSEHIIVEFQKYIRPGADVEAYLTHDWTGD